LVAVFRDAGLCEPNPTIALSKVSKSRRWGGGDLKDTFAFHYQF